MNAMPAECVAEAMAGLADPVLCLYDSLALDIPTWREIDADAATAERLERARYVVREVAPGWCQIVDRVTGRVRGTDTDRARAERRALRWSEEAETAVVCQPPYARPPHRGLTRRPVPAVG